MGCQTENLVHNEYYVTSTQCTHKCNEQNVISRRKCYMVEQCAYWSPPYFKQRGVPGNFWKTLALLSNYSHKCTYPAICFEFEHI